MTTTLVILMASLGFFLIVITGLIAIWTIPRYCENCGRPSRRLREVAYRNAVDALVLRRLCSLCVSTETPGLVLGSPRDPKP